LHVHPGRRMTVQGFQGMHPHQNPLAHKSQTQGQCIVWMSVWPLWNLYASLHAAVPVTSHKTCHCHPSNRTCIYLSEMLITDGQRVSRSRGWILTIMFLKILNYFEDRWLGLDKQGLVSYHYAYSAMDNDKFQQATMQLSNQALWT
jgi:hypothetical protein